MKYVQPYGVTDENAGYIDGNPALGVEGSAVPAKAIEHPMREIVYLITQAGLTPDEAKLTQVYEAIQKLIQEAMPKKQEIYELCEFYHFRQPVLRPGFQPAQGGLLANAATQYPAAWEYLQTAEGQRLCKTESEWQALTTATWATLADGTKVGWDGIGGAPFFVVNTANGSLRLPDIRGMVPEATSPSLGVAQTGGDAARRKTGRLAYSPNNGPLRTSDGVSEGIFYPGSTVRSQGVLGDTSQHTYDLLYDNARVEPVADKNRIRSWGALACVYLGQPS
jgi:hypothetical protein